MRISAATITTATVSAFLFAAAAASAQELTDGQIASIVVAASQADIDAGNLARTTTTKPEVTQFAQHMIVDHGGIILSVADLAPRIRITPQDNATTQSLKSGGEATLASLRALKGDAFDKAYIDNEVAYHQQLLDAIDKTLMPGVKNERLKALLVKMRLSLAAHLEYAKTLQPAMNAADAKGKKS
jgi:putative membrane protein